MDKKVKKSKQKPRVGDTVRVMRDIIRTEGLYASNGQLGVVKDYYVCVGTGSLTVNRRIHIVSEGKLLTLRTTSVEKVD